MLLRQYATQSLDGTLEHDIKDLVDNPRETLAIEIKSHVDLKERLSQANLARHICAIANHGGGYIVFGFDDQLIPAALPPDIPTLYHRDIISSIVSTYLSPSFLCDVTFVTSDAGHTHPIIRVPSHDAIPICAKKNGPHDAKNKPQGIVHPLVYIRIVGPNGPESVPISRPEDWEKLIRRCVLSDRTALLGLIEGLLTTPHSPVQSSEDILEKWHIAAHRRFMQLIDEETPSWKTPLSNNHYQLSYQINTTDRYCISSTEILNVLQEANTQIRDLVWTGWSMFYPFTRNEIAPYFTTDDSVNTPTREFLEASLLHEPNIDTTLPDFWRMSLDGKATLIRAYREDRDQYPGRELYPGEWLRPFFLAREIAEFVRHARALCQHFSTAKSVTFCCEWFGLNGRRIADPETDWSKERIARTDHRLFTGEWPVADLSSLWPSIVAEISSSVSRLFDPTFELSEDWVRRVAPKFRAL